MKLIYSKINTGVAKIERIEIMDLELNQSFVNSIVGTAGGNFHTGVDDVIYDIWFALDVEYRKSRYRYTNVYG